MKTVKENKMKATTEEKENNETRDQTGHMTTKYNENVHEL